MGSKPPSAQSWGFFFVAVATALAIGWLDLQTTEVTSTVVALLLGALLLSLVQPRAAWRWAVMLALGLPLVAEAGLLLGLPSAEPIRVDPLVALVGLAFASVGCLVGVLIRAALRPWVR